MDKMKDLRAGIEEMRSVAQRLITWADDLEKSFQEEAPVVSVKEETPAKEQEALPSRSVVKTFLTKLCANGYSAQVKALIASYGVTSLSAVPDESLSDLWDAALLLGEEDSGGETNAG